MRLRQPGSRSNQRFGQERLSFQIEVARFVLVTSQPLENVRHGLFRRDIINGDETFEIVQTRDLGIIGPEQHDLLRIPFLDVRVNRPPLQAAPLTFDVLPAQNDDNQVRLLAVQVWQIEREICIGELGRVIPVVEHRILVKSLCKRVGNLFDVLTLPAREGQRNSKSSGRIHSCRLITGPTMLQHPLRHSRRSDWN